MNIVEHLEHIKNIEAFRARVAEQYGGGCARLIDVAFIGHMDRDQQTRFIKDVTQRGLLACVEYNRDTEALTDLPRHFDARIVEAQEES